MHNSFGIIYRITSFGESHGEGIGIVIDGCPAGLSIDLEQIAQKLSERRPGQSKLTTSRNEADIPNVLSGIFEGRTTGAPLTFWVQNTNQKSRDYDDIKDKLRPNHADFSWGQKWGIHDYRGGGRASARETIARVIGGAVAAQVLSSISNMEVESWVCQVKDIKMDYLPDTLNLESEAQKLTRCPDAEIAERIADLITATKKEGDSVGGVIQGRIKGVIPGLGQPIYNKFHARLGFAMLGINAVKGFEIGEGFDACLKLGSQHNDQFIDKGEKIGTVSNNSGGVQGGVSNGEDITFRVGFKPTSTIMKDQATLDKDGKKTILKGGGRHDPCVLPRAVPIVWAMANMVLLDFVLLNQVSKIDQITFPES